MFTFDRRACKTSPAGKSLSVVSTIALIILFSFVNHHQNKEKIHHHTQKTGAKHKKIENNRKTFKLMFLDSCHVALQTMITFNHDLFLLVFSMQFVLLLMGGTSLSQISFVTTCIGLNPITLPMTINNIKFGNHHRLCIFSERDFNFGKNRLEKWKRTVFGFVTKREMRGKKLY